MSFGIKVKDSFACDSYQGVAWFCDEERALRYPTEERAEQAAQHIAKDYRYKIVPLAMNLEEAKAKIEKLTTALLEVYETVNVKEILNITDVPTETALSNARSIALKAGRVATLALARIK